MSIVDTSDSEVDIKVVDGTLRVRSARRALNILDQVSPLTDKYGYIDTGDEVERRQDRFYFVGRKDGTINVGGDKVHPEEVEAAINRHPRVHVARVRGRNNSILGAVVEAEVVLRDSALHGLASSAAITIETDIRAFCAQTLPSHKVPVVIKVVAALTCGPSGKLERHHV